MKHDFWHERWARNEIGFHNKDINPFLLRHWAALDASTNDSIFVPLCGKSVDLIWLAQQCNKVFAVELSQQAVEDFFAENKLTPVMTEHENFSIYCYENLQIFCGDFFQLQANDLTDCNVIYDRASLIALPPQMRQQYVTKLDELFQRPHKRLLITLEYDQQLMSGPPFSVPKHDVSHLFAEHRIDCLESVEIIEEAKRFKNKGLESLVEHAFLLQKS